ncbi:hypothetical protein UJ101_00181 [Flavobacteriaceae bacterium UJ101]|nr:hypothetical protein UJ101_00181 [Flavobacteriaceae bacterium UJ101]
MRKELLKLINRKDYIIKMIEQLINALKRITGLIENNQLDEALSIIKETENEYFKSLNEELEGIRDEELYEYLKNDLNFQNDQIYQYIHLLFLKATVTNRVGDTTNATILFNKVENLINHYFEETKVFSPELNKILNKINN